MGDLHGTNGDSGEAMHRWATDLFPLPRSLTGFGVRQTLVYLEQLLPGLKQHEVASGTQVLDWIVPDEWTVRDAFVATLAGERLVDFRESNLHVVGYSEPVDRVMSRAELEPHLHSLPDMPDAIPYVTSYYSRTWGFCLSQRQRDALGDGPFRVVIDSDLAPGSLTYADLILPGDSEEEILLSTYVCHPSVANNELSGPVVTAALGRWLSSLPRRRFTYRLVFAPETIGPIVYLSRHLEHLRAHVKAGWVVTCVGDERTRSYVPSRLGDTLADRISLSVLKEMGEPYQTYRFLDRGSDERQWCSPLSDLPVCSLMRSKYGTYPEYHTSLDDLAFVTPRGLEGGYEALRRCLERIEEDPLWVAAVAGEPQLGRRGLYPSLSTIGSTNPVRLLMDVLAYCDGSHDLEALSGRCGATCEDVSAVLGKLESAGVIRPS